ncbi:hypothetical protein OSB04_002532 [Centaurea solstitialis]|uniref:CCHC-type domain-containing protein n=1 Tax=Centaurea solstitialis TaxID=347529 RepID=A0AA38U5Q1_9ASTR|nr:hypothetical protein OSB04_002532 [Centaurea solstitialis]
MASTVTSTNNLSLRSILEKDKLTGSNFLDWERNLMIVLRHERKWYVLEEPLGEAPPANAPAAARNAHKKHSDDLLDVACLMLATMSPDLQAGLINTNAYDMIRQLRDMFQTQARTERYDATKAFNECKMVKGTSVSDHVMKMKRHLDHLERLGHPVPLQLATDTILNSLSEDYRPFVVNYNMNNMEKTIAELHSMLKTAELNMGNKNKTKDVLMVKDGGVKKKNGHASTSKGKGPVQAIQSAPKKGKGKGKGKKVKPNKARTENRCFICNEIGHWRQNCPKRHEAGRNHSSTQQLRKVAVLHIQELEVSPGSYDQLLNNSYKCCRLKVAQIFDRVANIGRDPRLRLLLGNSHKNGEGEELHLAFAYEHYETLFTMRINHGGYFTKFPGRRYIRGKHHYVDLLDSEKFSVHGLDAIMLELGYQGDHEMYYHFLTLGVKFVDVFVEHWKTELDTYKSPPNQRKLVVEEIDEPVGGIIDTKGEGSGPMKDVDDQGVNAKVDGQTHGFENDLHDLFGNETEMGKDSGTKVDMGKGIVDDLFGNEIEVGQDSGTKVDMRKGIAHGDEENGMGKDSGTKVDMGKGILHGDEENRMGQDSGTPVDKGKGIVDG